MTEIPTENSILGPLKFELPEAVLRKVAAMDELNQQAFISEFEKRRKSALLAFVLLMSFPCFHYLYLGKIWLNIIFWATVGGFGVWWLADLFRTSGMVRDYNKTVAIEVLKDIQILN